jgi:hypothetical protein
VLDCRIVHLHLVLFITHSMQLCMYLVTYNIIILLSLDVEANDHYNQMIENLSEDYPKLGPDYHWLPLDYLGITRGTSPNCPN